MTYPPSSGPYAAYSTTQFLVGSVPWLHVLNGVYLSGSLVSSPTTAQITTSFNIIDTDQDGFISPTEYATYCNEGWTGTGQQLTSTERFNIFSSADVDGDGLLSFDEFTTLVTTVFNCAK